MLGSDPDRSDGVRRHALTDAELAALGAGRPTRETIAELRAAQLGKHLLLLREIVRAAPTIKPWYADLAVTEHTHPTATRAVLADPLCGAWAAHCLKSLRAGHSPDTAGVDHLATLAGRARSRADPTSRPAPHQDPAGRVMHASFAGLAIDVRLEDVDPVRALLGLTPTGRLSDTAFAHWRACLTEAWQRLVSRHRAGAEVLAEMLQVIVPVEPDPAAHGISATSADAFGAVAMSAPRDGAVLAVGLLHEAQHGILNAVNHLFDLHTDPHALGYSPWRDDPRPASGILHGAFAYLAVTRFWRAEAAAEPDNRLAAFEFARWRAAVVTSAEELLAGGLTSAGVRLVTALRDEVRPWLDDPVEEEVARLAAGANADHRLRWRLRNRQVDPRTAEALADAWRAQAPVPAIESRLVPAPRRALESSARLTLAHRRLGAEAVTGESAGGRVTAGDAAYLRGDYETALGAYRKGVCEMPGDDAAWAGLALVGADRALSDSVEIVAAVYRALKTDADPLALARWLSLK